MAQWWEGDHSIKQESRTGDYLSQPPPSWGKKQESQRGLFSGPRAHGKLALESIPATSSSRVSPLSITGHDLSTLDMKLKDEGPSLWKYTASSHFLLHPKVHRKSSQIWDDQGIGIMQTPLGGGPLRGGSISYKHWILGPHSDPWSLGISIFIKFPHWLTGSCKWEQLYSS